MYKCWDRESEMFVAIKKWKDNDKDQLIGKMASQEIAVLQVTPMKDSFCRFSLMLKCNFTQIHIASN